MGIYEWVSIGVWVCYLMVAATMVQQRDWRNLAASSVFIPVWMIGFIHHLSH